MSGIRKALLAAVVAIGLAGCERQDTPNDLPAAGGDKSTAAAFRNASLETLAPLWPNTPTHIAVDRRSGVIYFCQPTKEGRDVVMQFGDRKFSETTALTVANVASELQMPQARGNFVALAGGGDGNIYFLFKGLGGKEPVYALGLYDPRTARLRVLADAQSLMRDSGLGASIDLAAAALVATDSHVYLLLSVLEEPVLLRIEPARLPATGLVELKKPFDRATSGDEVLRLGAARSRLSAGTGDSVLFIDTTAAGIFEIAQDGKAREVGNLIALPDRMSPAIALSAGRVAVCVSEGEEIRGSVESRLEAAKVRTSYPAILIYQQNGPILDIPRERISARPGQPVYALRIGTTHAESETTFIAYDTASGELMRVRLAS